MGKKILIVEQEHKLSEFMEDYGQNGNARFDVITATSIADAVAVMRKQPIDLVVSDHAGPGKLNGLELLRILHKLDIIVQVILQSEKQFELDRTIALSLGCTNFVVKPYSYDKLSELVANMLQPAQGFSGRLIRIKLEDIIQMCCYRKDSTLLSVFNAGIWGSIYIHNGGIIHAECEDLIGIDAFYEILGWDKGEFLSQVVLSVPKQTLFMDWQSLLMEGLRQKDEIRHALSPVDSAVGFQQSNMIQESAETERRIMIVDDSRFIRKIVFEILQSDPYITVAGYATNGQEALAKIDELKPDLILLDWDMPVMKGSTTLMHIMIRSPSPVVILSGFVGGVGANPFDLLCLGGVDFLRKPQNNWRMDGRADDLVKRIKAASRIKLERIRRVKIPQPVKAESKELSSDCAEKFIVLSSTTGGSTDLIRIVTNFPSEWTNSVVILHDMQQEAVGAFIDYLDRRSRVKVQPINPDEPLMNGRIYVHASRVPIDLENIDGRLFLKSASHIHPEDALDHFLISVAHVLGPETIGVFLSGGTDRGMNGMRYIKDFSGTIVVHDPMTGVDPRISEAAIEENLADYTCTPDNLVEILKSISRDIRQ